MLASLFLSSSCFICDVIMINHSFCINFISAEIPSQHIGLLPYSFNTQPVVSSKSNGDANLPQKSY